jgi:hypothetical protein
MTPLIRSRARTAAALALPAVLALSLSACSTSTSSSATTTTTTTTAAAGGTPTTLAGGTIATGGVTCTNVVGVVNFSPPLTSSGTSAETTEISLTASGCTTSGSNAAPVTGGRASATIQSTSNSCTGLLSSKPVAVAVTWAPNSIHASVASFSGYAIVPDAAGHIGFSLPGSGGTVTVAGSFAGSDNGAASKASTFSDQTTAQLLATCGTTAGVASLTIASGSVTLG